MPLNNQPLEKSLQNHVAKMALQYCSFKYTVIKYLFLDMNSENNLKLDFKRKHIIKVECLTIQGVIQIEIENEDDMNSVTDWETGPKRHYDVNIKCFTLIQVMENVNK